MSARGEKRRRALQRAGLSKLALREQREFEALVRRHHVTLDALPIVRRDTRRQVLACVALVIAGALLLGFCLGAR